MLSHAPPRPMPKGTTTVALAARGRSSRPSASTPPRQSWVSPPPSIDCATAGQSVRPQRAGRAHRTASPATAALRAASLPPAPMLCPRPAAPPPPTSTELVAARRRPRRRRLRLPPLVHRRSSRHRRSTWRTAARPSRPMPSSTRWMSSSWAWATARGSPRVRRGCCRSRCSPPRLQGPLVSLAGTRTRTRRTTRMMMTRMRRMARVDWTRTTSSTPRGRRSTTATARPLPPQRAMVRGGRAWASGAAAAAVAHRRAALRPSMPSMLAVSGTSWMPRGAPLGR